MQVVTTSRFGVLSVNAEEKKTNIVPSKKPAHVSNHFSSDILQAKNTKGAITTDPLQHLLCETKETASSSSSAKQEPGMPTKETIPATKVAAAAVVPVSTSTEESKTTSTKEYDVTPKQVPTSPTASQDRSTPEAPGLEMKAQQLASENCGCVIL
jgi:hypothetical protein